MRCWRKRQRQKYADEHFNRALPATEGKILVDGKEAQFSSPADAISSGIGMVHQHFKLIESFTVAENIALSDTHGSFKLDMAQLEADIEELSSYYGLKIDRMPLYGSLAWAKSSAWKFCACCTTKAGC